MTIDGAPCQPTPATVAFQTSKNLIPTNTQNNYTQTTAPDLVPAIQVQPSSSGTYDVSFNVYVTKSNNHTGSYDPSFNAIAIYFFIMINYNKYMTIEIYINNMLF